MSDSMGQSAPDHEGTDLEPDERDDEIVTLTRRELRIVVRTMMTLALDQQIDDRIDAKLKDHVRLDTVTPEEIAR